eukprot:115387-Pyramimonas_sp.AAC.1
MFKACAITATIRNAVFSHGLVSPMSHARLAKTRITAPPWGSHAGMERPKLRAQLGTRTSCNDAVYDVLG